MVIETVIYPVAGLVIFHPSLKEPHIEYNHTHTPTAPDQEKTECALCAQLFISISPVLRGTKWAFKLQGPESSVAGGQDACGCLGGGGARYFTGVAHLAGPLRGICLCEAFRSVCGAVRSVCVRPSGVCVWGRHECVWSCGNLHPNACFLLCHRAAKKRKPEKKESILISVKKKLSTISRTLVNHFNPVTFHPRGPVLLWCDPWPVMFPPVDTPLTFSPSITSPP